MAKPPCVLFLLDWRPVFWSTREEYYSELCRQIAQRGITPVLVVSEVGGEDVRTRLEQTGAKVLTCAYHGHFSTYASLIRRIAREYTVRFTHICFFDYFTAAHWLCRLAGIRSIVFFEVNSGTWRKTGVRALGVKLRAAVMCFPVKRWVAISEYLRGRLRAIGIAPETIQVIYNGIDLEAFHPDEEARREIRKKMAVDDDTVVLLFAAVFLGWKRPEVALQAFAELVRAGRKVQLWFASEGPLRAGLEQEVERMGIAAHVRFLGHQRDPQRWMAASDLLIHTSVGEAFGQVYVESMACGVPVVATRSGAVEELVEDGVSGRLVPPGSREAAGLAAAVIELTQDPQRYRAMSQAAMRRAARFGLDTCVKETMILYDSILKP